MARSTLVWFEQSLHVIERSCHAKTPEDIETIVDMLNRLLDIRSAAILIVERGCESGPVIVDTLRFTHPDDWMDAYLECNLVKCDPVVERALASTNIFVWTDALLDALASKEQHPFRCWARRFDIKGGLVCPFHSSDNSDQHFIFYTQVDDGQIPQLSNRLCLVSTLMRYPGEAIRRVYRHSCSGGTRHSLTNRELQVLHWAARGKTSQEIATILSISERTVKFHLSNTYEKLGVVNRQQAIAEAIQARLLS